MSEKPVVDATADATPDATPDATADVTAAPPASTSTASSPKRQRKGPISFLSGSLTSFGFGWLALQLAQRIVGYYAEHPPHYDVRFAQSIAVFMKTLIVGMSFLATFTFAFVGLGLFFTFLRSLMPGWSEAEQTP